MIKTTNWKEYFLSSTKVEITLALLTSGSKFRHKTDAE